METTELRPPYVLDYNKLKAFFKDDPTIKICGLDEKTHSCEIRVNDARKADILSHSIHMKNLTVNVINTTSQPFVTAEDIGYLLKDCPLFSEVYTTESQPIYSSVMMHSEIVKVDTDNAFSPSGCDAYTAQQLAREIFHGNHINFQTDFF